MSQFPQPPINEPDKSGRAWVRWYNALQEFLADPSGLIPWASVGKAGSNLTEMATRNHADLQNINTATYTHLSATHHTDLTDAGDSALHYHATDRARANHSGTQLASTVSDFSTAADARIAAAAAPDGTVIKHQRVTTGSVGAGATALITITWATTFADANYTVSADVLEATAALAAMSVVHIETQTAAAITVRVHNAAAGAKTGTVHAIAIHD